MENSVTYGRRTFVRSVGLGLALGLAGCLNSASLFDPSSIAPTPSASPTPSSSPSLPAEDPLANVAFNGCTSATALSTTSGRVEYEFPVGVEKVNVYIDGTLAYTSSNSFFKSYTDRSLSPGTTYEFACEAQTGEFRKMGAVTKTITTPSDNNTPVAFPGVLSVTPLSPSSVRVEWPNPAGVSAVKARVYATPGNAVDFEGAHAKEVGYSIRSATLTGLGDELPYSFGVRVCSAAGVCDENVVQITATLADGGAPRTQGAVSATYIGASSSALVHAPWQPADGGIAKRRVYLSDSTHGNGQGGNLIGNYVEWNPPAFNVADPAAPPTELSVTGLDSSTHYLLVRDEDPSGQLSAVQSFAVVNYRGCLATAALSTSIIRITYDHPVGADFVRIYQNGLPVFTSSNSAVKTFDSSNLTEGQAYVYECEMQLNGQLVRGSNKPTQKTLSINPPTFQGAQSVTALTPRSVRVNWNPTGAGVLTDRFVVYGNPGSSVDWNGTPLDDQIDGALTSFTATGLGDGLTYSFGVRACSETNNCDANVVAKTITLNDSTYAPSTTGATSVAFAGGDAAITAPWTISNGKVTERRVYSSTSAGGPFTLVHTATVADPLAVPTSITVPGPYVDNTTYYFYVNDVDGAANVKDNSASLVSAGSGDTTAPTFPESKFLGVAKGTPTDTALKVSLEAVAAQPAAPTGVSHYIVYIQAIPSGSNNTACTQGVRYAEFAVTDTSAFPTYTAGQTYQLNVTGLSPRTRYGVCLKARDLAGNVSSTSKALWHKTFDVTPPTFTGIGSGDLGYEAFVNDDEEIEVRWPASVSTDAATYEVKIWRGSKTVPVDLYTAPVVTHPTHTLKIPRADFAYNDFETLYVLVNACDDALVQGFHDTANNCTTHAYANAGSFSVPDVTPPPGFGGIAVAEPDLIGTPPSVTLNQGEVLLKWNTPSGGNWNDYAGLRVYRVDNATTLTQIGTDIVCTNNAGVITCPTQRKLTGLDAYKTYRFHVRAYDAAGSVTTYLNPLTSFKDARAPDKTPPSFTSNLNVSSSSPPTLTWSAATDNQTDVGSRIFYDIYRRDGSAFTDFTDPSTQADAMVLNRQTLTYTDTVLAGGTTYYYLICARDESANRTCDAAAMRTYTRPDSTPPTLGSFGLKGIGQGTPEPDRIRHHKSYRVTWTMSDNSTPKAQLSVVVYRKMADAPIVEAIDTNTDPIVYDGYGVEGYLDTQLPSNAVKYIKYLVKITDLNNNSVEGTTSVRSDTRMSFDVVRPAGGSSAGGDKILLKGSNFGYGVTVKVAGAACTNLVRFNEDYLTCTVPAKPVGESLSNSVVVQNTDGTQASQGFTYDLARPCDAAADGGAAPFHAGTGTSMDPYLICTATQLRALQTANSGACGSAASCWNKYFKVGNHIDFSGQTFGAVGNAGTPFIGGFDGDYHMIENMSQTAIANSSGLFGVASPATAIQKIVVKSAAFTWAPGGNNYQYYGILVGQLGGAGLTNSAVLNSTLSSYTYYNYGALGGAVGAIFDVNVPLSNITVSSVTVTAPVVAGSRHPTCIYNTGVGGVVGMLGCTSTNNVANLKIYDSTLQSTYNNGGVGNSLVGGIAGTASGITLSDPVVENVTISVAGTSSTTGVGGVIGGRFASTIPTVQRARVSGLTINASGVDQVGGIAGDGTNVTDSYVSGSISGAGYTGGIVGQAPTSITNTVVNGSVSGGQSTGGMVGGTKLSGSGGTPAFQVTIMRSANFATVSGSTYVGGLFGGRGSVTAANGNGYTIRDSLNAGALSGTDYVGGLVASSYSATSPVIIVERSYNRGAISSAGSNKGGLSATVFAQGTTPSVTLTENFWDKQASGQSTSPAEAANQITGKTTALMKTQATFTGAAWDFVDETTNGTDDYWVMDAASGYPTLYNLPTGN